MTAYGQLLTRLCSIFVTQLLTVNEDGVLAQHSVGARAYVGQEEDGAGADVPVYSQC